jgi:hypothetical protein
MDSIGQLLEGIIQGINNLIIPLGCLVFCLILVLAIFAFITV